MPDPGIRRVYTQLRTLVAVFQVRRAVSSVKLQRLTEGRLVGPRFPTLILGAGRTAGLFWGLGGGEG